MPEKIGVLKQKKIGWGAKRHHYSMVIIGRSMLEVHFSKQPWSAWMNPVNNCDTDQRLLDQSRLT